MVITFPNSVELLRILFLARYTIYTFFLCLLNNQQFLLEMKISDQC